MNGKLLSVSEDQMIAELSAYGARDLAHLKFECSVFKSFRNSLMRELARRKIAFFAGFFMASPN